MLPRDQRIDFSTALTATPTAEGAKRYYWVQRKVRHWPGLHPNRVSLPGGLRKNNQRCMESRGAQLEALGKSDFNQDC